MFLALQLEQMRNLEGLASLVGEQLRVPGDRTLMDAEHAQPAHKVVYGHLEHMGKQHGHRLHH